MTGTSADRARAARLSSGDWVAAAYQRLAEAGLDGVAVEPLAKLVGATKGSFYWHFKNRAELLDTVLAQWEEEATREVILETERQPPRQRVRTLLDVAFRQSAESRAEARILASAEHSQVGPVVRRVHASRLDYLRALMRSIGLSESRADARARILYAAYLGQLQLGSLADADLRGPADFEDLLDELVRLAES